MVEGKTLLHACEFLHHGQNQNNSDPHLFFSIRHWFSEARGAVNMGQRHPYKTKGVYHYPIPCHTRVDRDLVCVSSPLPLPRGFKPDSNIQILAWWVNNHSNHMNVAMSESTLSQQRGKTLLPKPQNGECRKAAVPGRREASMWKWHPWMHKQVEIFLTVTPSKETSLHAEATSYWICCTGASNHTNFIKAQFRQNRNPLKNKTELNSHSFPEVDKV